MSVRNCRAYSLELEILRNRNMKLKSTTLAVVAFSAFGTLSSQGALLATWDVSGIELDGATAPNSSPYTFGAVLDSGVASANLTLSTTVNPTTSSDQYGFKISSANAQTSLSGAISAGHYFEFTITANANTVLNLSSIELVGQSSATGANSAAILSSIDGFASGNELDSVTGIAGNTGGLDTDASGFGAPIDLTGINYQGITTATFRVYGWDTSTTSGAGTTLIRNLGGNDLIINGTTVVVPEPSAALLGALSALILLRRRR